MLALKLGLSLTSSNNPGGWLPTDESRLEAWYQNGVGITLNGSDVSIWADSSNNGKGLTQSVATEQPAYSSGTLTFVSADSNNLEMTGQVSLPGDFTIGFVFNPTIASPGTIFGDNKGGAAGYEFIKYTSSSNFRIRIDNSSTNIPLDSGTFSDDYLVITRVSNALTLWKNGVAQSTTPTLAGTADIDAIGVREPDFDFLDGTIKEVQIYSSSSADLVANINNRLSTL